MWSRDGVEPDPEKVRCISEMQPPSSKEGLRSFLGLATYVGSSAIPYFSSLTKPLWTMLKDGEFTWSNNMKSVFETLKEKLCNIQVRAYFDPQKDVVVQCDASPVGLGCVLLQDNRPILFASRMTTKTEGNYSQLEREFLGLVFALHRFKLYLIGANVTVQTDHAPILGLLKKPIDSLSSHLRRWILAIQAFEFRIQHIPGKENSLVDTLSRNAVRCHPSDAELIGESTICSIELSKPIDLDLVANESEKDDEIEVVIEAMLNNWQSSDATRLTPYIQFRDELTLFQFKEKFVLIKGDRTVIPSCLRSEIISQCHENHLGMNKMKAMLRAHVYWPCMHKDIEEFCRNCMFCLMHSTNSDRAPIKKVAYQEQITWSKIAIDITGPSHELGGLTLLTIIDLYSRYPEMYIIQSGSASCVIEKLCDVFARWGLPQSLVSDNAAIFTSDEFLQFLAYHSVQPIKAAVYYPQSNSTVERLHSTIKKRLAKMRSEFPRRSIQACLYRLLLDIRSTPNEVTGQTPFFMLTGRSMRTKLSSLSAGTLPHSRNATKEKY